MSMEFLAGAILHQLDTVIESLEQQTDSEAQELVQAQHQLEVSNQLVASMQHTVDAHPGEIVALQMLQMQELERALSLHIAQQATRRLGDLTQLHTSFLVLKTITMRLDRLEAGADEPKEDQFTQA